MTQAGGAAAAREAIGRRGPVSAVVVLAGVCAALHLGKLAPALPALQRTLGIGMVQGGFLLSIIQFAGMALGIWIGAAVERIGLRRSMLVGMALLAGASALGGFTRRFDILLALRLAEGLGFMLVAMPAPALLRRRVAPGRLDAVLGWWGAYMPIGVALALLVGPTLIEQAGWPGWWWALAALSAAVLAWMALVLPPDEAVQGGEPHAAAAAAPGRLRTTLSAAGPWLVALSFAAYAAQWMSVIGFLPSIYAAAGFPAGLTAVLTALAAAANIGGNVVGGRLLQRGIAAPRLLVTAFALMAAGTVLAFGEWPHGGGGSVGLPPAARYLAVIGFSLAGGMAPATLFSLAIRLAPSAATVSTTVGWMQQWSSFGQVVMPPLVAWLAVRAGGWQWTWLVTGACSLAGIVLSIGIGRLQRRRLQEALR